MPHQKGGVWRWAAIGNGFLAGEPHESGWGGG